MSSIKKVVIAGASGNFGAILLKELVDSKKFDITVLSRSNDATYPASVKVFKTDYTPASLSSIFAAEKFDAAISANNSIKPGAVDSDCALVQAASTHGVKRFIPCDFGVDISNKELFDIVPIWKEKVKVNQLLKSLESETFTWSSIVCGLWFDWGLRINMLGIDFKAKKFQRFDGGEHPFTVTNQATVGKAVANLLSDDTKLSATANKNVYIESYTITANQVIAAVQKITGEQWPVEEIDSEALEKTANEAFKGGNFYAAFDLMKVGVYGKRELGDYSKVVVNDFLGLQREDFEAQLREIVTPILQG